MSAPSSAPVFPVPPPVVVQFPRRRIGVPPIPDNAIKVVDDRPSLHDACALVRSAEVLRALATQFPSDRASTLLTQAAAVMDAYAFDDGAEVVRLVNVMEGV